jgi:hypothetical protein
MKLLIRTSRAALAVLVALAALTACGDTTDLEASFETVEDTLSAFAVSGTSPQLPSGLLLGGQADADFAGEPVVVRINESFLFDVAFDIDAAGGAVVYPYRLVASDFGSTRRVRVQTVEEPFDQLLRAPGSGYQDSVAVSAPAGRTLVIETQNSQYCSNDLVRTLYAKLVVDSVRLASREVFFRVRLDPNCGFRSFAPGIPAN